MLRPAIPWVGRIAGDLLDLLDIDAGETELVIHAMSMRRTNEQELFGEEVR